MAGVCARCGNLRPVYTDGNEKLRVYLEEAKAKFLSAEEAETQQSKIAETTAVIAAVMEAQEKKAAKKGKGKKKEETPPESEEDEDSSDAPDTGRIQKELERTQKALLKAQQDMLKLKVSPARKHRRSCVDKNQIAPIHMDLTGGDASSSTAIPPFGAPQFPDVHVKEEPYST